MKLFITHAIGHHENPKLPCTQVTIFDYANEKELESVMNCLKLKHGFKRFADSVLIYYEGALIDKNSILEEIKGLGAKVSLKK